MFSTEKYIEIPYKDHGRDFDGCDCYGLVRLILKDEFDIELPDYSNDYIDSEDGHVVSTLIDKYQPLIAGIKKDVPDPGDIAVFNYSGMPCHVGLYVGNNKVLHILRRSLFSVCEKIDSVHLKGRLEGFYEVRKP